MTIGLSINQEHFLEYTIRDTTAPFLAPFQVATENYQFRPSTWRKNGNKVMGYVTTLKKEAETMEISLVFTTLGSDQLNKGFEHKRRDWVFNVAAKVEPKDNWKIMCKLPITILKEVTGKT